MPKIVCKLCSCGLYHDISVAACSCGADLSRTVAAPVERETALAHRGQINEDLPVYVQKCSACGAESFTVDPAKRTKICHNCHKARIATVKPVLYVDMPEEEPVEEESGPRIAPVVVEEADDGSTERWKGVLSGVQSAVGAEKPEETDEDEDDDDDDEVGGWGSLIGGSEPAPKPAPAPTVSELTLTAIRYGSFTFTLKADQPDLPLMLGRSAACARFLSQDGRVGNNHCRIEFRAGSWYVIDNHSANGTAVNKRFLPINGERMLQNGDELMLGHHPDSMAFRVTIR